MCENELSHGIILPEVQHKSAELPKAAQVKLNHWMKLDELIHIQRPLYGNRRLVSFTSEARDISESRSRLNPYEFGVKDNDTVIRKQGLIVGARAFPKNPYRRHALTEQIEQTIELLQDLTAKPTMATVELGDSGIDQDVPAEIIHRGTYKTMSAQHGNFFKRRRWVKTVIGHLKANHRIDRCRLKGSGGDSINTVLCAEEFNLCWILPAIARYGLHTRYLCIATVLTTFAHFISRISGGNRIGDQRFF